MEKEKQGELSDICKECEDAIIERSFDHGHKVFENMWDVLKDHPEYDVEMATIGLLSECAHFLAIREWEEKDIFEMVKDEIDNAKEFLTEIKAEEEAEEEAKAKEETA